MKPYRAAIAACLLAACAAPDRLAFHGSPLLEPPRSPLLPEARPTPVPSARGDGEPPPQLASKGPQIASKAKAYVGKKVVVSKGKRYPDDCTGLVRAVFAAFDVDLFGEGTLPGENGVTAIYRFATRHGSIHQGDPKPGDLVFFRETYDRNRDGRENDGLTHIGIVNRVEPDGTVRVVHRVDRGVVEYRMNLSKPGAHKDAKGKVINDYLREGGRQRLAGELFSAYGSLAR